MKNIAIKMSAFLLSFLMIISCSISAFADDAKFGYDISQHNGVVDFTDYKESGNSFLMIRLGYYNHLDEYFWENVRKANEAQIEFGVYLYSYAYSADEAKIEADFVLNTLSQLGEYSRYFTLPVAYDLEEDKIVQKCTKAQINNQMNIFCSAIKSAGYIPMVYANLNWFTNYIDISNVLENDYKIWYAAWYDNPDLSKNIKIGNYNVYPDMWQYYGCDDASNDFDKNVVFNIDALRTPPCNHNKKVTVTKATLSADGKSVTTCSLCNKLLSTTVIPRVSSIKLEATSLTYNGKVRTPKVIVNDRTGKTLVKNTDYTVSYASGRKNVGKYAVKITFKGKYSGTKTLYFTIKPKATSISSVSAGSKKFTVKWKKQATQTTGYQVQYSASSKFTSPKYVTVGKNTTLSKTISKLKGGKKYYVRVRTYKTVGSTKYFSSWSTAKSVTTKK